MFSVKFRGHNYVWNSDNSSVKTSVQWTITLSQGTLKTIVSNILLPPASEGWRKVIFSVCPHFGGGGGVPGLGRGVQSQIEGGYPVSDLGGDTLSQVQGWYPVSVKGKLFDTRFGLIYVQTGKKILLRDPPPLSKGKIFGHQIWLDTC